MRTHLSFFILLSLLLSAMIGCTPRPKDILAGSYQKCQSIQYGYYEMNKHWKMMSRNDTIQIIQNGYFKKIDGDSLLPFVFNFQLHSPQLGKIDLLYTGDSLAWYSGNGGGIMPRKDNAQDIWQFYIKNLAFSPYLPITYKDGRPLPNPEKLASDKFVATYVRQESLNGVECDLIKAIAPEEFDYSVLKGHGYILRTEFNYWISKQDSIPLQITVSRQIKTGNDTVVEFEKILLTKYDFTQLPSDTLFAVQSISKDRQLQISQPVIQEELLAKGVIAPDWRLGSINGDTVALSCLRGNLVLLDFFHANCPPCLDIIPALQKLHDKYKGKGLHIIGLDKHDSQETLKSFIKRHQIEYPILLLSDWEVIKAYQVSAYPTTYLLDKDGKILMSHIGASLESLDHFDKTIEQLLK